MIWLIPRTDMPLLSWTPQAIAPITTRTTVATSQVMPFDLLCVLTSVAMIMLL